jgi:hypothetical protein
MEAKHREITVDEHTEAVNRRGVETAETCRPAMLME